VYVATLVALGYIAFLVHRTFLPLAQRRYPPGPKGWPLIGNLLDMPRAKIWETFTELRAQYGVPSSEHSSPRNSIYP
jgi:hypothetical protein